MWRIWISGLYIKFFECLPTACLEEPCHSISFCSAVDPIPVRVCCAANLYRLAISEVAYLLKLAREVVVIVGDDATLHDALNECKYGIPSGGSKMPLSWLLFLTPFIFLGSSNG